jgi:hypothetical protein
MVLEKTISPYDVEKVVLDTFGKNNISLVIANGTIVLTRAVVNNEVADITMASEDALAKDWLLPEEDKAWEFL